MPIVARGAIDSRVNSEPREDDLLSVGRLLQRSKSLKKISGVYFLFHGSTLMYIGKSLHVHERIAKHMRDRVFGFDAYTIVAAPKSQIGDLEARYIRALSPTFNKMMNDGPG